MTRIRCLGVLFDLDGVLVDSTPAVARVWAKWAAKHGFVPEDVIRQSGAEILRLWCSLVDYAEDTRIGPTILQTTIDAFHGRPDRGQVR